MSAIATDFIAMSVCLSVCHTLVHDAKAVGRNDILFGRNIHPLPNNIILDRDPPKTKGRFWGRVNIANYGQTVTAIAECLRHYRQAIGTQ